MSIPPQIGDYQFTPKGYMNDLAKKLLESIEKPSFVINKNGTYIGCNVLFESFLGVSKHKIIGQTAFQIAPIALANIYSDADAALYKARCSQVYEAVVSTREQAQSVVFRKTIFLDELDDVAGFIGVINSVEPCGIIGPEYPKITSPSLTVRELSALQLMAKGLTTKEIARTLLISDYTANDYVKSIFLKLGANNRVTALLAAQKFDLV